MSPPRPIAAATSGTASVLALQALAAGVAAVDAADNLIAADDRFLALLRIEGPNGAARGRLVGRRWSQVLRDPQTRLPAEDATALEARWSALLKDGAPARAGVRLSDGRTLELATAPGAGPGASTVLVVKDGTEIATGGERRLLQSGFVHDVNNTLGGMLANLYLATADTEGDHPARRWIEAVNAAAVDLRARLRDIAGGLPGKTSDGSRRIR